MAIGWFDSDDMRPLMAGKNIVRVGMGPAQYLTVADALTAIANEQPPPSATNPFLIIVGPGKYTGTVDTGALTHTSIHLLPGALFETAAAGPVFHVGAQCGLYGGHIRNTSSDAAAAAVQTKTTGPGAVIEGVRGYSKGGNTFKIQRDAMVRNCTASGGGTGFSASFPNAETAAETIHLINCTAIMSREEGDTVRGFYVSYDGYQSMPPVPYPLEHAGRVQILGCVAYVHSESPAANDEGVAIEVTNGNVTIIGCSFAALLTGAGSNSVAARGGVLKVNRATGGKSYALNCSFAAYCDSANATTTGLSSASGEAFQAHGNVAFAAQGGTFTPLVVTGFSTADFMPGGAIAHLITPVDQPDQKWQTAFEGLIAYDTHTGEDNLKYYDGTGWQTIATAD
jgi:hypothetical protein